MKYYDSEEIWLDIKGYEGKYQVSNKGNVKSINYRGNTNKEHLLSLKDTRGYLQVGLCDNGVRHFTSVHRLVAEAFIPNPNNLPEVNHRDEVKANNCVDNLEWCSREYNNNYGTHQERAHNSKKIPINQYTLDGVFIKRWDSAADASRELGIGKGRISKVVKDNKEMAYGYIWKRVGDVK